MLRKACLSLAVVATKKSVQKAVHLVHLVQERCSIPPQAFAPNRKAGRKM
jgi:hypothetical protein